MCEEILKNIRSNVKKSYLYSQEPGANGHNCDLMGRSQFPVTATVLNCGAISNN